MHLKAHTVLAPEIVRAILVVGLAKDDKSTLKTLAADLPWEIRCAPTLSRAIRLIISRSWPVIVCESNLPDGDWRVLLERIQALSRPPQLVVSSRLADEDLWADVLNRGGYDVLATPFVADEVHHVLSHAVDYWNRRVEMADIGRTARLTG